MLKTRISEVVLTKEQKEYALKEMQKVKVIDKKSEVSILYERELLCRLNSPFIVNMYLCFQDHENLYLLMDFLSGGDMRYHICKNRKFSEKQTQFFIACIILGLEYIHSKNIIHRDIKPENIYLTLETDVKIGGLGLTKNLDPNKLYATTKIKDHAYLSPEIILLTSPKDKKGQKESDILKVNSNFLSDILLNRKVSKESDLWALGCILFELYTLKKAFPDRDLVIINKKINDLLSDEVIAELQTSVANINNLTVQSTTTMAKFEKLLDASQGDIKQLISLLDRAGNDFSKLSNNLNTLVADKEFKKKLYTSVDAIDLLSKNLNKNLLVKKKQPSYF